MRMVKLAGFGGVDMLSVAEAAKPTISKATDVLIRTMAAGVNRSDISQRRGHYPPPDGASPVLGLEVAGVVEEVGSEATPEFKKGDRVMALLAGGGYAEYTVAHMGSVMPIPRGYSFAEAAAIPETFLTAWQILKFHGDVQAGQNVLIHAGASGIGSASSQLVEKFFKARAITTSSRKKMDVCKGYASIPLSRERDEAGWAFAPKVKAAVGEESIHLVVDPVFGGGYLEEDASLMAPHGRIVVVAFMGGAVVQMNALPLARQQVDIIFTKLRCRDEEYKTELVKSFEKEVIPYMDERIIAPIVSKTFLMEEVALAHRWIEENRGWGKVVLTMTEPHRMII